MNKLRYILIFTTVFNCVQLIQSDELMELSCLNERNCDQFQHSNITSLCIEEQCKCINIGGQTVECRPLSPKISNTIGGPCRCTLPNAECKEKQDICSCKKDYIPSSDRRRCIAKTVALGGECEQTVQCQKEDFNAVCHESKRCRCMDHFIIEEGKCVSFVGNKSSHTNDSQCLEKYGPNTKVSKTGEYCICIADHIASVNNSQCLKTSKYFENCTESLQCMATMGPGGKCLQNVCKCDEKYFVDEKIAAHESKTATCAPMVERGHYCEFDEDCHQRHLTDAEQSMHCARGECDCKHGYYTYNESTCIKAGGTHFKPLIGLKYLFLLLTFAKKYFV